MKAAVLRKLGSLPRLEEFEEPVPREGEVLVNIRAASLKPIDKAMASGSHYASFRELPAVCGVDGVGTLNNGDRVYFGGPRKPFGTMADRAVVPPGLCFPLPDNLDDETAAALPNPAASSWLPLKWRAKLVRGETVLILGATGVAGRLAVQIAKILGAGKVIAAGRNPRSLSVLPALGADVVIQIDKPGQDLSQAFATAIKDGVDVVIDYLWGPPTEALLAALTGHDFTAQPRITRLIEVGESAGATISLPGAALRSSGLEIYGSGGGSVPWDVITATIPEILACAARGDLRIDTKRIPLSDIEEVWPQQRETGQRVVFIP